MSTGNWPRTVVVSKKLMETQVELYGGVGVGGEQTLKRSLLTMAQETGDLMTLFKEEGVLNTKSLHMSDFEKWAFSGADRPVRPRTMCFINTGFTRMIPGIRSIAIFM